MTPDEKRKALLIRKKNLMNDWAAANLDDNVEEENRLELEIDKVNAKILLMNDEENKQLEGLERIEVKPTIVDSSE